MPYNITPPTLPGRGAFGEVPGTIPVPTPASDLARRVPGLADINKLAAGNIMSGLEGSISPGTMKALQDAAARFGMTSGMPGLQSGLALNRLFQNIAGATEARQQQALQDYNAFLPTVSRTQTVTPELLSSIAERNAVNLAAPNPAAAQSHAERLFNKYLAALRGPGGGTGGGGGLMRGGGGGGRDLLGFPTGGGTTSPEQGVFVSRSSPWGLGSASTPFGGVSPGVPYSPEAGATSAPWWDNMLGGGVPIAPDTSVSSSPWTDILGGGVPITPDTGVTSSPWEPGGGTTGIDQASQSTDFLSDPGSLENILGFM